MNYKRVLSLALLGALIILAALYLNKNISEFRELEIVAPELLMIVIVLFIVNYFFIAVLTRELLRALGVALSVREAFMLSVVTGFYNLITPFRGGMAARAVYLKKRHEFSYTNFLATLSASYVLIFLVASFLGILSTLAIYKQTGVLSWIIFMIFLMVFFGNIFIIFFSPQFKERENKWLNRFIKVANGWHLIKRNKKVIAVTIVVTLIQLILSTLMLYWQFATFGIHISWMAALFLSSIGNLSIVVGITPGNLGVGEAITVFSAATIGITLRDSLSAALLGRFVSIVVLFILGPLFSYLLLKRGKNKRRL